MPFSRSGPAKGTISERPVSRWGGSSWPRCRALQMIAAGRESWRSAAFGASCAFASVAAVVMPEAISQLELARQAPTASIAAQHHDNSLAQRTNGALGRDGARRAINFTPPPRLVSRAPARPWRAESCLISGPRSRMAGHYLLLLSAVRRARPAPQKGRPRAPFQVRPGRLIDLRRPPLPAVLW